MDPDPGFPPGGPSCPHCWHITDDPNCQWRWKLQRKQVEQCCRCSQTREMKYGRP